MGLDMYLKRKMYVGNKYKKPEQMLRLKLPEDQNDVMFKLSDKFKDEQISEIVFDAGYWRKANAIHKWFVENVQNGVDECQESYVEHEQLQKLLDVVNKVLEASELIDGKVQNGQRMGENGEWIDIMVDGKRIKNPKIAHELLPTQEGFFFGGKEYDEYYYQDLVETKKILEEALTYEHSDFYYRASW